MYKFLFILLIPIAIYRYNLLTDVDNVTSNSNSYKVFINGEVDNSRYGVEFVGKLIDHPNVHVAFKNNKCDGCSYGVTIQYSGSLRVPDSNGDFNRKAYLLSRGIQFEASGGKSEVIKEAGFIYKNINNLFLFKKKVIGNLKKYLNQEEAALGAGILISGKGEFSKPLLEDFRRAGLIHLVVLSGFNVTIVAQVIIAIFSFLPKLIGATFGTLGILLFAIMVGGGATVIRSVVMAVIGVYSRVYDKEYVALYALIIAGLFMITYNPYTALYDPSFQLSFMATLGLILNGNFFSYHLRKLPEFGGLREIVSSSLATQFFVTPLILKMSGDISVYSIVSNLIVVPIMPFVMLLVFILIVLSLINLPIIQLFVLPPKLALAFIIYITKTISNLKGSVLHIGILSNYGIVVWYIFLIPISVFLYRKFRNNNYN